MALDYLGDFQTISDSMIDKGFSRFSTVFINSNENLSGLFDSFSVVDKNILTVVGSGDQYFWSRFKGAASVDTFDLNRLSIYYLYLRKWLIKYCDSFYLNIVGTEKISSILPDILSKVKCQSENEFDAFNFWLLFIQNNSNLTFEDFFNLCKCSSSTEISDTSKLGSIISSDDISFFEQDLSGELTIPKKYDIVIISNILEHLTLNRKKIEACRDNLYSLLNDGGEAICTYLLTCSFDPPTQFQNDIFREKFDVHDLYPSDSNYYVGYSYVKK